MVLGGVLTFTSTVQTPTGTTLNVPITFTSSDTAILNLSANGVACAGHWDDTFTTCIPGGTGPVTVTASALGSHSVPTYIFVHPQIDNITVTGVLLDGVQVQEPCLSQSQSMTLEAHAYSQGADVTASVGPFTWSASNSVVVGLTPLVDTTYHFATNRATALAEAPGITNIFASANGVTSSSFQQPQLTNGQGTPSPVLDFFSTCPIQNIALELGAAGSGRTTFAIPKGSISQAAVATVTDIMGASSLPNNDNGIVLSRVPLTWTSSRPGAIGPSPGCTQSCALTVSSPGSATITASCSPPSCNVGFPTIPLAFTTEGVLDPNKITACTNYFKAIFPQLISCQQVIPLPVYASPVFVNPPNAPLEISRMAAISGTVTGAGSIATVFASSTGCQKEPPATCSAAAYYVTSTVSAGSENPLPVAANSFLFDPTGTKIWMGSDFGAQLVTPTSLGGTGTPFASLGTITGRILATSANGFAAVFSDTVHNPNQVYVATSTNPTNPALLNISGATLAGFTPDGLKTFIFGGSNSESLYIYSSLQALRGPIALAGPAKAIAFSPNGAFTYIAEASNNASPAQLVTYANCGNQPGPSITLPADPILMKVLPALHIDGSDSLGHPIPDGIHILVLDSTGFDIITSIVSPPAVAGALCPQVLNFTDYKNQPDVQRIELNQGTLQPVNFFYSADDTQLYIVSTTSSSIIVYNFINAAVIGGIELQNNATAVTADMTSDGGTIVIAGSDGLLHEVNTTVGGSDGTPISFPNLPNFLNPFCSFDPAAGPCSLNVAIVKP